MNCAELVGDQNGNVKVKTYDWILKTMLLNLH